MKYEGKNCWEFTECGREPGGSREAELGVCPAAVEEQFDGINDGKNAGRFCWVVAGTLCKDEVQGAAARKLRDCLRCSFFLLVEREKGRNLVFTEHAMKSHSPTPDHQ